MQTIRWTALLVLVNLLFGCTGHYFRSVDDTVRVYLRAPRAEQVEMRASFNGFAPLPAKRLRGGTWMVTVPRDTSFTYFYRIDGRAGTPDCALREQDDFGQWNCIFQQAP